jgi:hypothetical protein
MIEALKKLSINDYTPIIFFNQENDFKNKKKYK